MGKIAGWFYQIYAWLIVYPLSWVFTIMAAILSSVFSLMGMANMANRYVAGTWARLILWITPARVHIVGAENIDPDESYVIICNHQSTYDIFVLYGWFPLQFRWVMKMELRKMPFVGPACHRLGHVFVDRSNKNVANASIEEAKRRLPEGVSVVFFPEGTRGKGDELLRFKRGAFNMARDMNWPLLPVSIQGADKVMPAKSLKILPGRIKMTIHAPISREQVQETPMKELMKESRATIARGADAVS
ncbi:lysophospholipid acyltransferase family protein [Marinicella sp. W31]|uniref:lysophospholipid acyltransferase family protein n=1 Tax=Marinicella sp. W31 TaxID=3023713 RepID=UPI0037570C96